MHRLSSLVLAGLLAACASPPQGQTPYTPTPAMLQVLQERQAMHAREPSDLQVYRARDVPTMSEAADAIPNVKGLPADVTQVPHVERLQPQGPGGLLSAEVYRPDMAKNLPVILYYPGGTWATGALEQYQETPRELAKRTGWIVVTLSPRLAPEAKFPAIHDDAFALYRWARANMRSWGGDPTRVALAGEGPGGNLALSVALQARDQAGQGGGVPLPDQLLLITPVAGTNLHTRSMRENAGSRPLTRSTVSWAQDLYASGHLRDPRIDLAARNDFARMPPTTFILAPIDPLRSGAETLAAKMRASAVPTEVRLFPGMTYDFFGLGQRVPEAAQAEDYAVSRLKAAFSRPSFAANTAQEPRRR